MFTVHLMDNVYSPFNDSDSQLRFHVWKGAPSNSHFYTNYSSTSETGPTLKPRLSNDFFAVFSVNILMLESGCF